MPGAAAGMTAGLASWCEIDAGALQANVAQLRAGLRPATLLGIAVKSNAYGHGLVPCARLFVAAGADWLVVHAVGEATRLRAAGIRAPVYVCGRIRPAQAEEVVRADARVVVSGSEDVEALGAAARATGRRVCVHLKLETGMHRQGVNLDEALTLASHVQRHPSLVLEGLATHLADMADEGDHALGRQQLELLQAGALALARAGFAVPVVHGANSAAALLWPESHHQLVRVGIAAYGLWPSAAVRAAVLARAAVQPLHPAPVLTPALSWRARLSQVKSVPAGAHVGYGCTYRTERPCRIAVLPVGYYEGFDRRLSNVGQVLVAGRRAAVRGRVCMNLSMVDVTDIPAAEGAVATLLGRDGDQAVTADDWAEWMGTINYEVVARIHPDQPRLVRLPDGRLVAGDDALLAAPRCLPS